MLKNSFFDLKTVFVFRRYFQKLFLYMKTKLHLTAMKRLLLMVAIVYLSMCALNIFRGGKRSIVLQKDKINVISNQSASKKYKREILGAFTVLIHMRPNFIISLDPVNKWIKTKETQCNGNFVGYNNLFAHLQHVQINPHISVGRKGGKSIEKVIGQPEKSEYMTLKKGYFGMRCHDQRLLFHFKSQRPSEALVICC